MPFLLLTILTLLISMFVVYTLVEWRATLTTRATENLPLKKTPANWPMVSVLLPVYNEKMVVRQLLQAVSRLDYPADKLEILVLDDSTDECSATISASVKSLRKNGLNIRHLRRNRRIGFKAGNLAFGLEYAKGEFIAIFDADCRPSPDFLKMTIPYFTDSQLGFLQTGIEFYNADNSFLTHFQALEASHKDKVTRGLTQENYMASLTGSACVWRRACIDAIGGISADTVTEDVDMGYAAQLDNWHCAYITEVLACAELPETMASFRVQRQRWARGLVHNAWRHAGKIFTTSMDPLTRIHAVSLVFSPLMLALFYLILLLAPLVAIFTPDLGLFFHFLCIIFLLAAICWGWLNTCATSKGKRRGNLSLFDILRYILLFFPLSLYYMSAIIQLVSGKGKNFHKTPKGCGCRKIKHPPINTILFSLEVFSLFYAIGTMALAVLYKNYWVLLYSGLCAGGFSMSLYFSLKDLCAND